MIFSNVFTDFMEFLSFVGNLLLSVLESVPYMLKTMINGVLGLWATAELFLPPHLRGLIITSLTFSIGCLVVSFIIPKTGGGGN